MGLVLAVVGAIAGVAYREVRAEARAAAGEHLQRVSRQLADLFGASARQLTVVASRVASDPAVQRFARQPGSPAKAMALSALKQLAARNSASVAEIWDTSGTRLIATADAPHLPSRVVRSVISYASARADERAGTATARIGPIDSVGARIVYHVVAPISVRGSDLPIGYVVAQRVIEAGPQLAQLSALIGPESRLLVGNSGGDLWTDLRQLVAPPAATARSGEAVEYEREPGVPVISATTPIPLTPWSIAIESSRSTALGPAYTMLWRLAGVAALLLLAAMVGAWLLSGTLTRPVRELAVAVDAFSAGDYSKRIHTTRQDELGAFARGFNTMADRITGTLDALHNKVDLLRDAETRYRMLFDASPQPMWVYDLETLRFLAVNDAAVLRYGYSRDQFLAMSIVDIRPGEDVPALLEDLNSLGPDRGAQSDVWRHRAANGATMDVEVSSRPIDFAGRRSRIVLVSDLTERRRAEAVALAAHQRLERVIASSGAMLYELRLGDAEPVLEWISDNIVSVLGYTPADAYRSGWWTSRVHPDDLVRLHQSVGEVGFRDGVNEYRFRANDGRYRWIRDEQRVVVDPRTGTQKVVGAWIETTEQRQLEQQFQQAQKMEAVGRLAGGVAHDFNNLLTVMMAESQLLMAHPQMPEPNRADSVAEIHKAAQRAALLTRQLLTFSRQQLIEPQTIDVNDVVRDVDAMLRRLIGEDVELRLELAPEAAVTHADRGQIEQVIANLAVNARDAMPDGGVLTIETSVVTLDEGYRASHPSVALGAYVLLAVSDTGTGMTDEVAARIFEPFFTTKPAGKGTGLGLASAFGIARRFHGHIAAYSELGIGTTMKVYLPYTPGPTSPDIEHAEQRVEDGTETVLLVEDDAAVRRIGVRMLTSMGYGVLEAADADQALALFERRRDDIRLLLTDVVLPRVGGRQLAEQVTSHNPAIRVLFMSGYSDDVVLQHRLTERGVLLLHKPFTAETLAAKVRDALEPKRPA